MNKDFRNFTEENDNPQEVTKETNTENKKGEQYKNYEELVNKYKDMDSSHLMNELYKEASKMKSEGTLTPQNLDSLYSSLSPYLNDEQKNILTSILKSLL